MKQGSCICNVLWFIFAGWHLGLCWCFLGLIWCCTIIGIPFGLQAFKIGCFIFWPFGKEILEKQGGADGCDCFLNFLWIIFGGLFLCIGAAIEGALFCITICGIPCGMQLFKLAKISLTPFGRQVVDSPNSQDYNTIQPIVVVQPTVVTSPQPQGPQYIPPSQPQGPQYIPPSQPQYGPPQYGNQPQYHPPNGNLI